MNIRTIGRLLPGIILPAALGLFLLLLAGWTRPGFVAHWLAYASNWGMISSCPGSMRPGYLPSSSLLAS